MLKLYNIQHQDRSIPEKMIFDEYVDDVSLSETEFNEIKSKDRIFSISNDYRNNILEWSVSPMSRTQLKLELNRDNYPITYLKYNDVILSKRKKFSEYLSEHDFGRPKWLNGRKKIPFENFLLLYEEISDDVNVNLDDLFLAFKLSEYNEFEVNDFVIDSINRYFVGEKYKFDGYSKNPLFVKDGTDIFRVNNGNNAPLGESKRVCVININIIESLHEIVGIFGKLPHLKQYEQYKLTEGLILSVSPDKMCHLIDKMYPRMFTLNSNPVQDRGIINVAIAKNNAMSDKNRVINAIRNIQKRLDVAGWFISLIEYRIRNSIVAVHGKEIKDDIIDSAPINSNIVLVCESKFGNDVTGVIRKHHQYLYHVTPLKNLKNIQRNGLSPKSQWKRAYHPDRVYLGLGEAETCKLATLIDSSSDKSEYNKSQHNFYNNQNEYALLRIKVHELPDTVRLTLDPQYNFGTFTSSSIPPSAIELVKTFKV